jgi:hypothetical protein
MHEGLAKPAPMIKYVYPFVGNDVPSPAVNADSTADYNDS